MGFVMMLVRSYYRKDKTREGKEETTSGVILAVLIASYYDISIAYSDYILWQVWFISDNNSFSTKRMCYGYFKNSIFSLFIFFGKLKKYWKFHKKSPWEKKRL